ncbi:MAG TPA: hypothetical protein VL481_02120 [Verrucomicrobiae bacterium]|nr:hypothetical protein [Verrucomicrobiae bacterium]
MATNEQTKAAIRRVDAAMKSGGSADSSDLRIVNSMASQAGWGLPAMAKRALKGQLGDDE